ncbi:hypothetical protein KTS45_04030 [Halomicroarcula limicola]|uniref:CARDB domain-containing protein n=1 Tax=Haloarcula limicola TaxID=1429915 RepID=A0A8J7Y8T5_9EURY|nr:hypothetical protein [Halomicroarcula limicola]MBV0923359.1 hypothetical protein [Halomicroarcula limicola]
MRRLTALVLIASVAVVPVTVAGAGVDASVSNVTISPASPAPGESITFTPTIRNAQSSTAPLQVNAIAIRRASGQGITEYERVTDVGTISPGSDIQVPLTHTFDEAGTRNLRLIVYGENANTNASVQLRYPISLSVEENHPQLDVRANESVAGVPASGAVTVANGLDTPVSNVEITVSGDGVTMLEDRTVLATLPAGNTASAPFRFRPESDGAHELEATLSYTVPGGTDRTVTRTQTIRTEELREGVVLDASGVGTGTDRALAVDVINQGNAPAEDVVVTASSANATFQRAIVSSVPAGSSKRVRLNATMSEGSADVSVDANYEIGTRQRSAGTTAQLRSVPGAIRLTGVSVSREGGHLQISGSASNVGMSSANSVIVGVAPTENVEPVEPNKDYFVGTVPSSDFVSFDVTARTTGNVSSVPVQVSYLVDGTRKQRTFQVETGTTSTGPVQTPAQSNDSGGGLLPILAVGAVAVVVVAGILIRWSRRSDEPDDI